MFHRVGITFAVYGEDEGTERLILFDVAPRILPAAEWQDLDAGLRQRVRALNTFIADVYHGQDILRAGVVPAEQVLTNPQCRPEMQGIDVPGNIYAHIAGIDIVRADSGQLHVLEHNLCVPAGVSYVLENRKMMMRLFPELFAGERIAPVEHYPGVLLENLRSVAPTGEGVCQDHAHALIACCRAAGIPASHVSGYFHTGDVGEVASHAWADAWLGPEDGWLSVDLTHRSLAGPGHCRLAVGRDYLDAAPVRGVRRGGGAEQMRVAVVVATSAQQQ